jgi:hypothetical protein
MKKFILFIISATGLVNGLSAQTLTKNTPAQSLEVSPTHPSVMFQTVTGSINEINLDKSIKIFPNPTSSELNIVLEDGFDIKTCDLYIYDERGKLVLTERNHSFKNKSLIINSQNLAAGLYTLVLKTTNNGATVNKKFVVTK